MFFEVYKRETGYDIVDQNRQQRFLTIQHITSVAHERWCVHEVDQNNKVDPDIAPEVFDTAKSAMSYVLKQAKRKHNLLLQPQMMSGEIGRLFDLDEIMNQAGR